MKDEENGYTLENRSMVPGQNFSLDSFHGLQTKQNSPLVCSTMEPQNEKKKTLKKKLTVISNLIAVRFSFLRQADKEGAL